MKIVNKLIKLKTEKYLQFIDLTDEVKKISQKTKIKNGLINVYSRHTTVAIRINEKEKGIFADFAQLLDCLIPKKKYYQHNDLKIRTENLVCTPGATDCLNGHSHCQHLILGTSETIPVINGKLALGVWQRIFAIELDEARPREIIIQVIGE